MNYELRSRTREVTKVSNPNPNPEAQGFSVVMIA